MSPTIRPEGGPALTLLYGDVTQNGRRPFVVLPATERNKTMITPVILTLARGFAGER